MYIERIVKYKEDTKRKEWKKMLGLQLAVFGGLFIAGALSMKKVKSEMGKKCVMVGMALMIGLSFMVLIPYLSFID